MGRGQWTVGSVIGFRVVRIVFTAYHDSLKIGYFGGSFRGINAANAEYAILDGRRETT
jgi:hypothetical protein